MNTRVRTFGSGSLGVVVGALLAVAALPAGALAQDHEVTFTRDVMPILQDSCQACHREGAIAPMSLMSYQETRPWARAIRDKVSTRTMPPWYIDPNVGVQGFKYDRSLSQDQIDTIVAWVDAGAPQGNPEDLPPPRQFADRDMWHIGEPDWVVPIPEPFVVPAEGANWWGDFFSPSGLTEDVLDQGGRDQAVGRGLPGGAPRGDPHPGDGRCGGGRLPERVRPGQERRHLPAGHRPPRQGELGHPVQHALRVDRARRHRPHERRAAVLSRRAGSRRRSCSRARWPRTSTSTSRRARTTCGTTATIRSPTTCG